MNMANQTKCDPKRIAYKFVGEINRRMEKDYDFESDMDKQIFFALVRKLRFSIRGEPRGPQDEQLLKVLNNPIVHPLNPTEYAQSPNPPMHSVATAIRNIDVLLKEYLACFEGNPELLKDAPIGICPTCDKLYVKKTPNQKYCSETCRKKL